MSGANLVSIALKGNIDISSAENIAIKIRAAVQNKVNAIHLVLDDETDITCAGLLAFIVTTAKQLKKENRTLLIKGANSKIKILFDISQLSEFLEKK